MRKRNIDGKTTKSDTTSNNTSIPSAEKYINGVATFLPESVKPYLEHVAPFIGKIANLVEQAVPYVKVGYEKCTDISRKLEPYRLDLLTPAFCGIILCFFGGSYVLLISAIEVLMLIFTFFAFFIS